MKMFVVVWFVATILDGIAAWMEIPTTRWSLLISDVLVLAMLLIIYQDYQPKQKRRQDGRFA